MLAALGAALLAGNFFAFSTFLMKALKGLSAERGIVAMQAITMAIKSLSFLIVFFGTAVLSAVLAVTADEAPGQIDLVGNDSIPAFIALLASGEFLQDKYREQRQLCINNLNAVGQAIKAYREKNDRDPQSLLALVPEYLEKDKLICPFDHGKEGHKCSYEGVVGQGDPKQSWLIDAWCPHRLHGRIVLRRNGRASSSSEERFIRSLEQTRRKKD